MAEIPIEINLLIRNGYWIVCPDYQTAVITTVCQDNTLRFHSEKLFDEVAPHIKHQIRWADRHQIPGLVVMYSDNSKFNWAERADIALLFRKDGGGEYLVNLANLRGWPDESPPVECSEPTVYIFLPSDLRAKLIQPIPTNTDTQ